MIWEGPHPSILMMFKKLGVFVAHSSIYTRLNKNSHIVSYEPQKWCLIPIIEEQNRYVKGEVKDIYIQIVTKELIFRSYPKIEKYFNIKCCFSFIWNFIFQLLRSTFFRFFAHSDRYQIEQDMCGDQLLLQVRNRWLLVSMQNVVDTYHTLPTYYYDYVLCTFVARKSLTHLCNKQVECFDFIQIFSERSLAIATAQQTVL